MSVLGIPGTRRALALCTAAAAAVAMTATASAPASGADSTAGGTTATYLVVYKEKASTTGAATAVAKAGGQLVANYSAIGVVVAKSSSPTFASTIRATKNVEGAVATSRFGVRNGAADAAAADADGGPAAIESVWGDSLSGLQWDMTNINVPQAHAINAGSDDVLVADLDTGLDFTHPDLAPNYDAANSTDCSSGAPSPLLAGNDVNGHGTHTAGTIAAAANGIGIVGVAPGVRIAGVKTSNDNGFFFPEMVICAYMWVATHNVDITNNSYFADPWLFNCKYDAEQRAIWNAERRAIRYAQSKGTVVVASAGNFSDDLSHPTTDVTSPDDTVPVTREITNACAVVPVEVPGVIGVSATGYLHNKSYYSSYGISAVDVAAPGGDRRHQIPPTGNGRVLSTWPYDCGAQAVNDSGAWYCWAQGTSMASPHAAGVAALIASESGLSGGALASAVQVAVNPLACPTDPAILANYVPFPGVNSGLPQVCTGGTGHNSWYGAGEVDALKAVQ